MSFIYCDLTNDSSEDEDEDSSNFREDEPHLFVQLAEDVTIVEDIASTLFRYQNELHITEKRNSRKILGSLSTSLSEVLCLSLDASLILQISVTLSKEESVIIISIFGQRVNKKMFLQQLGKDFTIYSTDKKNRIQYQKLKDFCDRTQKNEDKDIIREPCEAIFTELYPHQKKALHWMIEREKGNFLPPFIDFQNGVYSHMLFPSERIAKRPKCSSGGVLGDDMGLGKTLTVISLILTHFQETGKPLAQPIKGFSRCESTHQIPKNLPLNVGTKANFKKSSLDIFSACRPREKEETKNINTKEEKEEFFELPDPMTNKKLFEEFSTDSKKDSSFTLSTSLETFNSVLSQRTKKFKSLPRQTLIVCPLSLLHHWISEFERHVKKSVPLSISLHHGDKKTLSLNKYDVVVTTYGALASEYKLEENKILLSNHWLRVILDEGHIIKNSGAVQTKAALALRSERKWILTGTPIQNNLKELMSLVHWLSIEPFTRSDFHWKKFIHDKSDEGLLRLQHLLSNICLRRLKTELVTDVSLPKKTFGFRYIKMNEKERKIYETLQEEGIKCIRECIRQDTVFKNYAMIFALLLRLRQFVCHSSLLPLLFRNKLKESSALSLDLTLETSSFLISLLQENLKSGVEICAICLDTLSFEDGVITHCKHIYCKTCLDSLFNKNKSSLCPLCRCEISRNRLIDASSLREENDEEMDPLFPPSSSNTPSSKISAILQELEKVPKGEKIVIVSQFTAFLSILQGFLKDKKFEFLRIDGSLTSKERQCVLDNFSSGPIRILLLSLKAGGVGLNLVAANHLFLCDPSWNPSTEDQVFDRIYRIGQKRSVFITKFIVETSIEERILKLQEMKKSLALGAFQKTSIQSNRLREIEVLINYETN